VKFAGADVCVRLLLIIEMITIKKDDKKLKQGAPENASIFMTSWLRFSTDKMLVPKPNGKFINFLIIINLNKPTNYLYINETPKLKMK
jgi:hypothetical protein